MYNPKDEAQLMFGMTQFQPQDQQLQLIENEIARLHLMREIAREGMEASRETYEFGLFQVVRALATYAMLKQAFAATGMLPAMEPWLMQYTQQYLSSMVRITNLSTEKIIDEIQAFDPHDRNEGAIPEFIRRILGQSR